MRKRFRWLSFGVCVAAATGCADTSRLTMPSDGQPRAVPGVLRKAIAPDGGEAPVYSTWGEVPETAYHAEVWNQTARVTWKANVADSFARMSYIGNRASITFNMTILYKYSTVASPSPATMKSPAYLLTEERGMGAPFSFTVSESCGQVANLHVYFLAESVLFLQSQFTQLSVDDATVDTSGRQAACTCRGGTELVSIDYDPLEPGGEGECDGGSGGGDEGGGTQYSPGDSTGGETVSWETGQGDGGSSVCGQDAVVEYVCIDILIEDGWREWACGYVTTC